MINNKSRNASLDIVRVLAIIMVIVVHGVETVWSIHPGAMKNLPTIEGITVLALHVFGRLGVPLFLFLTGYLMLGYKYSQKNVIVFYKKRVVRLLIILFIWSVIYYLYDTLFLERPFKIPDLIRQILFISNDPLAPHLWYMPVIISLYLFIPFVSNVLLTIDKKVLKILMSIAIFYLFFVPTCSMVAQAFHSAPLINNLELHYMGGICGVMMVMGYLIKRYQDLIINKLKTSWLVLVLIISFIISTAVYYLTLCVKQYDKLLWYDSIFILLGASCLFMLLLKLFRDNKNHKVLTKMSTMTFGCYLVHYVFVYTFKIAILKGRMDHNNSFMIFMVIVLGSAIMSMVVTSLACKSKLLAYVFGVK